MIHTIDGLRPCFQPIAPPKVGQAISVRGEACRVQRVYPFGTIDVVTVDGARAYRLTGLGWVK